MPSIGTAQGAGGGLQSAAWMAFGAGCANVRLLYLSNVDPALGTGGGLSGPLDLCPGPLFALVMCWGSVNACARLLFSILYMCCEVDSVE